MFKPIMPDGRTELGNGRISLPDLSDDMASVLTKLGFKNADVMGYSHGRGVALGLAAHRPEMVRRLAWVSAVFVADGLHPEMRERLKLDPRWRKR